MPLGMPDTARGARAHNQNPPPARLLDLSRSLSRAGRRPTGVDRVELAYLDHFLDSGIPLFGLVRTGAGYLLLDADGLESLLPQFHGRADWGPEDWLSGLFRKRPVMVRRAESALRAKAVARSRPRGLSAMVRRSVPNGTQYINTGQSHLSHKALRDIRAGTGGRIAVMIHDTIPLDFPEFQRPGTPEAFAEKLEAVRAEADLVICNSRYTQDCLNTHLPNGPASVVAPLGVDPIAPNRDELPADLDLNRPYFVAVGTIEPRKGHDLLLDVWDALAETTKGSDMPGLMICGARGWNNDAVFARLDALPANSPIRELPDLSDAAIAALLIGSRGLLNPSIAEGFGLPPVEAARLGVPVVLSDLTVYRETLGDIPVYANETDRYLWRNIVARLMTNDRAENEAEIASGFRAPSWSNHFDVVCKKI